MAQADAWRMVRKRALAAGIMGPIGNHSFRGTGDRSSMTASKERLTQDEVERIRL